MRETKLKTSTVFNDDEMELDLSNISVDTEAVETEGIVDMSLDLDDISFDINPSDTGDFVDDLDDISFLLEVPEDEEISLPNEEGEEDVEKAKELFESINGTSLTYLSDRMKREISAKMRKDANAFKSGETSALSDVIAKLVNENKITESTDPRLIVSIIRSNGMKDFLEGYGAITNRSLEQTKRHEDILKKAKELIAGELARKAIRISTVIEDAILIEERMESLKGDINCSIELEDLDKINGLIKHIDVRSTINEMNLSKSEREILLTCDNGHQFKVESLGKIVYGRLLLSVHHCPECNHNIIPSYNAIKEIVSNLKSNVDANQMKATGTNASLTATVKDIPIFSLPDSITTNQETSIIERNDEYLNSATTTYIGLLKGLVEKSLIFKDKGDFEKSIATFLADSSRLEIEDLRLIAKSAIYNSHFFNFYTKRNDILPNMLDIIITKLENNEPLDFLDSKDDFLEMVMIASGTKVPASKLLNKVKHGYNFSLAKLKKYRESLGDVTSSNVDLEAQCESFLTYTLYYDVDNVKFNPYRLQKDIPNIDEIVDRHLLTVASVVADIMPKILYKNIDRLGEVVKELYKAEKISNSKDPVKNSIMNDNHFLYMGVGKLRDLLSKLKGSEPYTYETLKPLLQPLRITMLKHQCHVLKSDDDLVNNAWAISSLTNNIQGLLSGLTNRMIVLNYYLLEEDQLPESVINSMAGIHHVSQYPAPMRYEKNMEAYLISYLEEIEMPLNTTLAQLASGFKGDLETTKKGVFDELDMVTATALHQDFDVEWGQAYVNASPQLRELLKSVGIDYDHIVKAAEVKSNEEQ